MQDRPEHLAVVVAGPDDDDVGDRAVADPPFLPVQYPFVAVAAGAGFQGDDVGAVGGSVNANAPRTWQVAIRDR